MSGYEFTLFAPYNEAVSVMGSWNDWKPIPMKKDDQGIWRKTVDLPDGRFEYKFLVKSKSWFSEGEEKAVADPLAMQLSLKRDNAVLNLRGGKRVDLTYKWKHDKVPLPRNEQMIIYELHVADFTGGPGDDTGRRQKGRFSGVLEKLDYLADLGVNAIEFMPVTEFPFEHSWGYSQTSLYAVENTYGSPDEFAQLVDECHARGIRVIQDIVCNHMQMDAPLTQIDFTYWFHKENPDGPGLDWGPKYNFEFYDENLETFPARAHVVGAIHQWAGLFHIDGYRFDATRALRYYDLLDWLRQETVKGGGPGPIISIAEHSPQDPTIAGIGAPMDAAWYEHFGYQMRCTTLGVPRDGRDPHNTGEVLRILDPRRDGWQSAYNVVTYIDNHDQDRVMWAMGAYANTFDDAAFRRMKLGAGLLLTAPGIPMIWMGQEFGEAGPKTMDKQPLDWVLLEQERNQSLFQYYKKLIALRKSNPALHGDTFEPVLDDFGRGLIGFKRWNDQGNVVVVVANLRDQYAGGFEIGGLEDGVWREQVWDYDNQVQGSVLRDTLAESEVKVFIKQ